MDESNVESSKDKSSGKKRKKGEATSDPSLIDSDDSKRRKKAMKRDRKRKGEATSNPSHIDSDDPKQQKKDRKKDKKLKGEANSNPSHIDSDDSKQRKKDRKKDKKLKDKETGNPSQPKKVKKQSETTPEKVSDDSEGQYSAKWSSSSSEPEHQSLFMPMLLVARNFPKYVTEAQVKRFFKGKAAEVAFHKQYDGEGQYVRKQCLVSFDSFSETDEALKLNGSSFDGAAIYVARNGNDRAILCVSGFNNQVDVDVIKGQLREIFQERGEVLNIFLPENSAGNSLGFAYVYLNHEGKDEKTICQEVTMGGTKIQIRNAKPRKCFHAEMVGKETIVEKEDKKTALKRVLLPTNVNVPTLGKTLSWMDKRPDIKADDYRQQENNCWAVALSREYTALRKILRSPGPSLTPEELEELVDPAHQVTGRGINRLKNAIPIMRSRFVKDMIIHQRPRGNDVAEFEDFEKRIIGLLEISPVMVSVDVLDDDRTFDGKVIYSPTEACSNMRTFEKFSIHCMLLTGYGIEDDVEFWELHDSNGSDWGVDGFIRIARHKCMIKSVVELQL